MQDLRYEYGQDGNVLNIQDRDPMLGSPQTQNFVYDGLHRLTHAEAINGIAANYSENYQYDATTGNLSVRGASTYNYGAQSGSCPNGVLDKAHAVVSAGSNSYCYDLNGNMVRRTIGADVTNLSYDGDNRLVHAVKGTFTADFIYDGDGNRIVSKQNEVNTVYIGNYFEWTGSTSTMKRYYYAGTMRVAMRLGSATPLWLFGDHLGSTSLVANSDGSLNSELRYKAWGETRFTYGTSPTSFRYTGQREESSFGLYYYGARWYDPALSRLVQPDSLIPESTQGVQAWDRFSYANNNPSIYSDPSGHFIFLPTLIAAAVGAVIAGAVSAGIQYHSTGVVDINGVLSAAVGSAVAGAVFAVVAPASIAGAALAGGAANLLGNQATSVVDAILNPSGEGFLTDYSNSGGIYNGTQLTNIGEAVGDFVIGGTLGGAFTGLAVGGSRFTTIVSNPIAKPPAIPSAIQLLPKNNLIGIPGYFYPATQHYFLLDAMDGLTYGTIAAVVELTGDVLKETINQCADALDGANTSCANSAWN